MRNYLRKDGVNVIEETLQADPDGGGSAALMRWRVKLTGATPCFLKLQADET